MRRCVGSSCREQEAAVGKQLQGASSTVQLEAAPALKPTQSTAVSPSGSFSRQISAADELSQLGQWDYRV